MSRSRTFIYMGLLILVTLGLSSCDTTEEARFSGKMEEPKRKNQEIEEEIKVPRLSPNTVAVIAPSVSTSMEARKILAELGWHEVPLRNASCVLVVVRSMLFNPLIGVYSNIG